MTALFLYLFRGPILARVQNGALFAGRDPMFEVQNITITLKRDGRTIARNVSFTLGPGDKAALIGEEGNGKSTLMKYIYDPALVESYCAGEGRVSGGRLGYLPQSMDRALYDTTLAEYFAGTEYYLYTDLMDSLGLNTELLFSERTLGSLSGGEKVKVQLLRLQMDEPEALLLDEPTNDLDIETLEYMERFLKATRLPVLFISHDEVLIERTANMILHMEMLIRKSQCRMTVSREGYGAYLARRRANFDHQEQVAQKQRDDYDKQMEKWRQIYSRVDHEQRTISRGNPSGGRLLKKKMHSVQSMGRRFEREKESFLDFPEEEKAILTRFDPAVTLPEGKTALDVGLKEVSAGGKTLCRNVRLQVVGPRIVGITGKNGAGKSTLLRLLWEQVKDRRDVTAAYMPQDYSEALPSGKTAVEYLAERYDKEQITRARTCLGSMRFTHEEMTCPMERLSGGQRAKILFLDMVIKGANLLLLDEPTRNFSPLSAPVVRAALRDFGGAIVSVSHDRKYLWEVCDQVYSLEADGLKRIWEE